MADLDEVVRAHIANQAAARPPALDALLHRARRRRQRQLAGMVAGVAAAVLGFGSLAAGAGVPWTQQRDTARYAAPVATGGILDEGVAEEGSWKVVAENDAEEGWCVRYITPSGDGGVCDLATPGRLDEVALFATSDGAEPITVVAGGVPEVTSTVEVGLSDGTAGRALVRTVSGRPFFSIRIPAAVTVARLTALDPDGRVLEERGPLPPPPLMPPSMPPPALTPLEAEARPLEDPVRCGPGVAAAPCGGELKQGMEHVYTLQTHCGIKGLYAGDRQWIPSPGQIVGDIGAPNGFEDPEDMGTLVRRGPQSLEYTSSTGTVMRFQPGAIPADSCN